jgi:hypothetical protein
MEKGPGSVYDKCNISVVICDTDIHKGQPRHGAPVFSGVRVTRSVDLCVCFVDRYLSFCPFLAIVLSVLLRFTDSDYPFKIFLYAHHGFDYK